MKVSVMVGMIEAGQGAVPAPITEDYDGPLVEHDTEGGELYMTVRDLSGRVVHWARYAEGTWMKVFLVKDMEPEERAELLSPRNTAMPPVDVADLAGPPPGNSGPH